MTTVARVSNEELVSTYQRLGSVWAAGRAVGLAGQTVHEKLVRLGVPLSTKRWTPEEEAELRRLVDEELTFADIALRLGRSYAAVTIRSSRLGLTSSYMTDRKSAPRRAKGADEAARRLKVLRESEVSFSRTCRQNSWCIEGTATLLEAHLPDEWESYRSSYSVLQRKECGNCGSMYTPMSGRQRYCSRRCGNLGRHDQAYFGGRRQEARGLAEGMCQLCGEEVRVRLAAHHVMGKENDPDNGLMVALCAGCHAVVGVLASKPWASDPDKLQQLLVFAWLRANGSAVMASPDPAGVEVEVLISPFKVIDGDEVRWDLDGVSAR